MPLLSPEKGQQVTSILAAMLLLVSGVYYSTDVLPEWMQTIAKFSPVTYALRGMRGAMLDGNGVSDLWSSIWPLLIMGAVLVPAGMYDLPGRRALRQTNRSAQAKRMSLGFQVLGFGRVSELCRLIPQPSTLN